MSKVKIIVVDRGWVLIGRFYKSENSILLKNAHVIRVWGTTEGIGELCIKGKLETTVLDKCFDVEIPDKSVIMILECDQTKWDSII